MKTLRYAISRRAKEMVFLGLPILAHHDNRRVLWYIQVVETKWCPACQQPVPRAKFYRNAAQPDGLAPYCRPCWSAHNKVQHARRRGDQPDRRRLQMIHVRHDYFAIITRPIQAYVLGLLASDGNVAATRPRIQFTVHEDDRALTETIRNELAPQSPIITQWCRTHGMAKVHLTSPTLCADLARYGIVPRKSLTLAWPDSLPDHLANSFLLGVYDGDGWLTTDRRKRTPYYIAGILSASQAFIEQAALVIHRATGCPLARPSSVNGRALAIRYSGQNAHTLTLWLHRDLPGLPRKRIPPLSGGTHPSA